MRTTVYDISLGSKKPRQVICTSRDMNMLLKCNRARRENVARDILFLIIYKLFADFNMIVYHVDIKNI